MATMLGWASRVGLTFFCKLFSSAVQASTRNSFFLSFFLPFSLSFLLSFFPSFFLPSLQQTLRHRPRPWTLATGAPLSTYQEILQVGEPLGAWSLCKTYTSPGLCLGQCISAKERHLGQLRKGSVTKQCDKTPRGALSSTSGTVQHQPNCALLCLSRNKNLNTFD